MFEVGKKYESLTTNGLVIEVLFVTDKSAFSRIVGHKYPNYIGVELKYQHDSYPSWEEYKEPRTITRWVNVWERDGELMMGRTYHSKEEAMDNVSVSLATIPITYTEPH